MSRAQHLPQIDNLYAYNLKSEVPFTHRHQETDGYEYINGHNILKSDKNGVRIYHQSVEINGVTKGLTMVTLDDNENRVKEFFDASIEQLKDDPTKACIFYTARKPVRLEMMYMY